MTRVVSSCAVGLLFLGGVWTGCEGGSAPQSDPATDNVGGKADDANATSIEDGLWFSGLDEDQRAEIAELRFDVADVSFLWPVGPYFFRSADPQADQPEFAWLFDAAGDLVPPQAMLERLGEWLEIEGEVRNPLTGELENSPGFSDTLSGGFAWENLAVVGFRFDDCAPGSNRAGQAHVELLGVDESGDVLPPAPATMPCAPQLRLVAQYSSWKDAALHLIYTFVESPPSFLGDMAAGGTYEPRDDIGAALIRDLQVLKSRSPVPTDGAPLGVHPGLAADPDFQAQATEFVRFYARPEFLTAVAYLSTNDFDGGSDWVMGSVIPEPGQDYEEVGALTLPPLLMLQGSPLAMQVSVGVDDFEYRFDEPLGTARAIRDGLEHTDAADFVDLSNPDRSQVPATDCVTCHRETHALVQATRDGSFDFVREVLTDPDFFRPEPGITAFVDPAALQDPGGAGLIDLPSFHNFGHIFQEPTVAMRTAHDSAAVAASINAVLHGDPRGPGLTCDEAGRVRLLISLLAQAGEVGWEQMDREGCQ